MARAFVTASCQAYMRKKRDAIGNAHCARECRDPGLHLSQLPLGFAVPAKELHVSRMTLNDGAVVADTDGKAALRGEMFDALSYAIIMADEALAGLGYEDAIVLNTTVMRGDLITHFNGEHVYNHHDLKYKVITSGLRVNASVMLRVRRPSHRLGGKPVRFLWNVSLVPKELHATGHLNEEFIECSKLEELVAADSEEFDKRDDKWEETEITRLGGRQRARVHDPALN